jgi:hypothetical protein
VRPSMVMIWEYVDLVVEDCQCAFVISSVSTSMPPRAAS